MKRVVGEAEKVPFGYGLAYWDWARRVEVVYPIPINLIVRLARSFYFALMKGLFKSRYEQEIQRAYHTGYSEGYSRGYDSAVAEHKSYQDIIEQLKKWSGESSP
jgi:hypothetical protein